MISVCMATYNGSRFIREQLESILLQLPTESEIVVADDGSTDDTLSVVSSLNDSRIRVLPAESHLGVIYNFERALHSAKGDIIFLSDQDDVWLPRKVEKVLDLLKTCDLVMHNAYMSYDGVRGSRLSEIRPYARGLFRNWLKNSYHGCCMAFRRSVLEKALPFPKKLPMHDQWLGLIAEKYFKVGYLPEPLVDYRQHTMNATHLGNSSAGLFKKIKWRLDLLKALQSV